MTEMIPLEAKGILGVGNRESLDIINLILMVCLNGRMKTRVMYGCNLNSKQVQDYLELLQNFRLLEKSETGEKRTIYRTNDRGRRFIQAYAELLKIFDISTKIEQNPTGAFSEVRSGGPSSGGWIP